MAATHEERLAHLLAANPLTDDHQKERRPSFNSLDRCASAGDGGGSALTLGEQLKKIALLAAPDPAMDGVLAAEKAWAAAAAARAGEWSPARLQRLVRGKLLGGGGFASVWACTVHGEPLSKEGSEEGGGGAEETVYALKALHKGRILALHAAPRVALEKEALGALSFHPYVTTLHATFQDASTLYFIMERATGGDMFSLLERRGKVPEPHARHYVACVGLALRALHDRGLVYRDLKPENVLLDSAGHPLLADMGFAQQVSPHGRTHSRCGSEEYAPPELLDGPKNITRHADVYSFAMVLYELLTVRLTNFLMSDREPLLSAQRRCFLQMDRPYYGYPGWRTIEQGHLGVDLIPIWASQDDQRPAIHPTCPAEWEGLMTECWSKRPRVRKLI